MDKLYKEELIAMINNCTLNKEILINCIARINKKVSSSYRQIKQCEHMYKNGVAGYDGFYKDDVKAYEYWVAYRKPILTVLMQAYRMSLDEVKLAVKEADSNRFPTYKMIDQIREIIATGVYSFA